MGRVCGVYGTRAAHVCPRRQVARVRGPSSSRPAALSELAADVGGFVLFGGVLSAVTWLWGSRVHTEREIRTGILDRNRRTTAPTVQGSPSKPSDASPGEPPAAIDG